MPTLGKHYSFPCQRWLSKDKDDGHISRVLVVDDAQSASYKPSKYKSFLQCLLDWSASATPTESFPKYIICYLKRNTWSMFRINECDLFCRSPMYSSYSTVWLVLFIICRKSCISAFIPRMEFYWSCRGHVLRCPDLNFIELLQAENFARQIFLLSNTKQTTGQNACISYESWLVTKEIC